MRNTEFRKGEQLCWNCKRIVTVDMDECPWLDRGEPVKGWDAIPTVCDYMNGVPQCSYAIKGCPLYQAMPKSGNKKLNMFRCENSLDKK